MKCELKWVPVGYYRWRSAGNRFRIMSCDCDMGAYKLIDSSNDAINHPPHFPTVDDAMAAAERKWQAEAGV